MNDLSSYDKLYLLMINSGLYWPVTDFTHGGMVITVDWYLSSHLHTITDYGAHDKKVN